MSDTTARLTSYRPGDNACNGTSRDSDFIAALSPDEWDDGAHCYTPITIFYGDKSLVATVTDQCYTCSDLGLNLSPALFELLTGDLDLHVAYGSWVYGVSSAKPEAPSSVSDTTPPADTATTLTRKGHQMSTTFVTTSTNAPSSEAVDDFTSTTWSPGSTTIPVPILSTSTATFPGASSPDTPSLTSSLDTSSLDTSSLSASLTRPASVSTTLPAIVTSSSSMHDKLPFIGLIIGIVSIGLVNILFVLWMLYRRHKRRKTSREVFTTDMEDGNAKPEAPSQWRTSTTYISQGLRDHSATRSDIVEDVIENAATSNGGFDAETFRAGSYGVADYTRSEALSVDRSWRSLWTDSQIVYELDGGVRLEGGPPESRRDSGDYSSSSGLEPTIMLPPPYHRYT
ncbi:hypothetical protein C8Q76DRAFT_470131 [Earliella scabrosa]|nr:hypothetical protein C8Q76DRAFT_470131 [Earliella scabrosa]